MRIAMWNVRFGGRHDLKAQIALATRELRADIVVICEAMLPTSRGNLMGELELAGWEHQVTSPLTSARQLGVHVVSRTPIELIDDLPGPAVMPYRQIAFRVEGCDLEFMGLYVPPMNRRNNNMREVLKWMVRSAPMWAERDLVIIGDINTGTLGADEAWRFLPHTRAWDLIQERGMVDAFRLLHPDQRVYTWWAGWGGGLRIDHCLVSPSVAARVRFAHYPVEVGPYRLVRTPGSGEPGLSDHAAMIVDIDSSDLADQP